MALLLLRVLIADAPAQAARVKALALIAPAWDMTELMWQSLPAAARKDIEEKGVYLRPSALRGRPLPDHAGLLEDGREHLIGTEPFDPGRPLHILHGCRTRTYPGSTRSIWWRIYRATGRVLPPSPTASTASRVRRTSRCCSTSSTVW
jgi:hypothetical protein